MGMAGYLPVFTTRWKQEFCCQSDIISNLMHTLQQNAECLR
jgi:hypothetical protein